MKEAAQLLWQENASVTAERDAYRAELDALRAAGASSSSDAPMPERSPARSPHAGASRERTPKQSPVRSLWRATVGSGQQRSEH